MSVEVYIMLHSQKVDYQTGVYHVESKALDVYYEVAAELMITCLLTYLMSTTTVFKVSTMAC